MKIFLTTLLFAASVALSQATMLTLNGNIAWDVTEPRCTFKLNGKLINGTTQPTGSLKLMLYATQNPFPAPGFIVAESTLGVINGGFQIEKFTLSATTKIPSISGSFIFTVVVSEYDGVVWRNVLALPGSTRTLAGGDFTGQQKWSLPTAQVQPPVARIGKGDILRLSLKATNELNQFPATYQERTDLFVDSASKLTRKFRGTRVKASFTYKAKNTTYNGQPSSCGVLTIKVNPTTKSTLTFFYQTNNSGTYRSVDVTSSGTDTSWGSFKLL